MGAGLHGLPGDFTPPSRFVRATVFSATAIPAADAQAGIFKGFHILNNFDIPVGSTREKADGKTYSDMTMFTTMRGSAGVALLLQDLRRPDASAWSTSTSSTSMPRR